MGELSLNLVTQSSPHFCSHCGSNQLRLLFQQEWQQFSIIFLLLEWIWGHNWVSILWFSSSSSTQCERSTLSPLFFHVIYKACETVRYITVPQLPTPSLQSRIYPASPAGAVVHLKKYFDKTKDWTSFKVRQRHVPGESNQMRLIIYDLLIKEAYWSFYYYKPYLFKGLYRGSRFCFSKQTMLRIWRNDCFQAWI